MSLPENIKRIRKEKGLTQKQLGELCGIDEANIRKYENGKQNPKIETIERIAVALDCSSYDLRGIPRDSIFEAMAEVGDYIQLNRNDFGLSQKELSEILGISIETLNCYEHGKLMPPKEQLIKLSEIFYTSIPVIEEMGIPVKQSWIQKNETLNNMLLMPRKRDKPKQEVHFSDLEPLFSKLNPVGKTEILKRLEELTHLKQYTEK